MTQTKAKELSLLLWKQLGKRYDCSLTSLKNKHNAIQALRDMHPDISILLGLDQACTLCFVLDSCKKCPLNYCIDSDSSYSKLLVAVDNKSARQYCKEVYQKILEWEV